MMKSLQCIRDQGRRQIKKTSYSVTLSLLPLTPTLPMLKVGLLSDKDVLLEPPALTFKLSFWVVFQTNIFAIKILIKLVTKRLQTLQPYYFGSSYKIFNVAEYDVFFIFDGIPYFSNFPQICQKQGKTRLLLDTIVTSLICYQFNTYPSNSKKLIKNFP